MNYTSPTSVCCDTSKAWELCGCADGVAYVQLVVTGTTGTSVVWVNTETGDVEDTKPAGFVTGTCQEAAAADILKFSADAPAASAPFTAPKDGYTTIVTSDGTEAGDVVGLYLYDAESATWTPIPLPSEDTLVGLTPALTEGTLVATFTTLGGEEIEIFAPDPVAMINDDQVLTGAANTNVTLTFTPTTVPDPENPDVDQVNYVIGASAKIDGVTIVENPTTKVLSAVPPEGCCVPTGGTEGQVLSVDSTGALVWTTPPAETSPRFVAYTFAGGETEITLPSVPVGENEAGGSVDPTLGIVHVSRNGADISHAWTWDGAVGTYDPALNLNCTIDAGDVLQFHWEAAV